MPAAAYDEPTRLKAVRELLLDWQAGRRDRLAVLEAMHDCDVWDLKRARVVVSSSVFQDVVVLFWEVYDAGGWRSDPATDAEIDNALRRLLLNTVAS